MMFGVRWCLARSNISTQSKWIDLLRPLSNFSRAGISTACTSLYWQYWLYTSRIMNASGFDIGIVSLQLGGVRHACTLHGYMYAELCEPKKKKKTYSSRARLPSAGSRSMPMAVRGIMFPAFLLSDATCFSSLKWALAHRIRLARN